MASVIVLSTLTKGGWVPVLEEEIPYRYVNREILGYEAQIAYRNISRMLVD